MMCLTTSLIYDSLVQQAITFSASLVLRSRLSWACPDHALTAAAAECRVPLSSLDPSAKNYLYMVCIARLVSSLLYSTLLYSTLLYSIEECITLRNIKVKSMLPFDYK